jgi:predicted metallo-beta-lactamase superfamily hydrolase
MKQRMPKIIKVTPIAEESLGVRSMCTTIETPDTKILLDAGTSLAPRRNGYPPHPKEYQALAEARKKIAKTAETADIVTISHYHFDHHTPSYIDWFTNWSSPEIAKKIYQNKHILAKSYRSNVNASQRRRGWMFKKTGATHAKKLETADNKTFNFKKTTLKFSEPVFHGPENSELGWIVMLTINYADEKVMFASDAQGPMHTPTVNKILDENPQLLIIGGPPTYLAGFRVKDEHIKQGMQNLQKLVENIPTILLEHHTLRDKDWRNQTQTIFEAAAEKGHRILTAAEYLGTKNNFLEFRRRQLFETEPPTSDFEKWLRLPLQKRKLTIPPI